MTLRIPSLDGLRAISFLVVFVAHAGLERIIPGGFGVTVFFFLSGYLITTLLRVEHEQHGTINLKHFWFRRALRILPPFYLVLLIASVLTVCFDFSIMLTGGALTAQLLHFTNYWTIYHGYEGMPLGTGVYWSLAVEEHFYLFFPWLYLLLFKLKLEGRAQAFTLWGVCGAVLLWRCLLVYKYGVPTDRTYMGSDTRLDSILFGSALAVWNNPMLDKVEQNSEQLFKYLLFPASIGLLIFCFIYRDPAFRETVRYSLQGVALTGVFIAAVRYPQWLVFRTLNSRFFVFVGGLSYSLYLIHFTAIFVVQKLLQDVGAVVQGVTALLMSLVFAWGSYLLVEKPCAKLRKKLSD